MPTPTPPAVPRWLPASTLVVCVLGILDSAYLTFEHYTQSRTLACSDSGAVNCLKVTTSSYATVWGVPVAVLGLLFFVGMALLCLPAAWRRPQREVHALRLAGAVVGVLSVLYLVWVELFRLEAICLWCTGVHVLAFLLFVLLMVGWAVGAPQGTEAPRSTTARS